MPITTTTTTTTNTSHWAPMPTGKLNSKNLPRILCLHGGGVNAAIFEAQSRALVKHLQHSFRLIWADAPFLCNPHADVVDVYAAYAPFRRWLRWLPEHAKIDAENCIEEIGHSIRTAMEDDDKEGGMGEWAGLLGFSQGAHLSASMLLEQQVREAMAKRLGRSTPCGFTEIPNLHWKFGILFAGRAPLSNLNPSILISQSLVTAGDVLAWRSPNEVDEDLILRVPTLHVHGTNDPGLSLHRALLHNCCFHESTQLVEWEGAHRMPLKTSDVEKVAGAIYDIAEKVGVKVTRTV